MHKGQQRVRYLDGLRGVAILLVVGWHYLGPSYAALLPYGMRYSWLPGFNRGWIGVQLFFLISGYVIFLTLERCRGFLDFIARRWLRLFPAMLVVSLALLPLSRLIGRWMPDGSASPIDLLPGLTFVDPLFYRYLLGVPVHALDGVFWTLEAEVAFYVVIGLLYFPLGWRRALAGLVLIWLTVVLAPRVLAVWPLVPLRLFQPLYWAKVDKFGWFASGALFLKARETGSPRLFAAAVVIGIASALDFRTGGAVPIDPVSRGFLIGTVVLFALAQRWVALQRLLEARPLLFVGGISYALYLCHNNGGVALLALLGRVVPPAADPLLPIAVAAAMLAVAWFITRMVEPRLTALLRPPLVRLLRVAGGRAASASLAGAGAPAAEPAGR